MAEKRSKAIFEEIFSEYSRRDDMRVTITVKIKKLIHVAETCVD